jgi:hypothetical protein
MGDRYLACRLSEQAELERSGFCTVERERFADLGHKQKIVIDRFLRVHDAAPGPTCCDRRGLTHSE